MLALLALCSARVATWGLYHEDLTHPLCTSICTHPRIRTRICICTVTLAVIPPLTSPPSLLYTSLHLHLLLRLHPLLLLHLSPPPLSHHARTMQHPLGARMLHHHLLHQRTALLPLSHVHVAP